MTSALTIIPITGIGRVVKGDDVAQVIANALDPDGLSLLRGDVLVVTHKIVSKAEGMVVEILDEAAYRDLVDSEAAAIIRRRGDLVITQTRHGFICANAGVDRSNTEHGTAVLLPKDPDRSAHRIRHGLAHITGVDIAVIVSDTFGRPWRRGLTDVAIGLSGLDPILDLKGTTDTYGRTLDVTEIAVADELAAAADLVMGKAEAVPAAIVRGYVGPQGEGRASDLVRPSEEDLFR